MTPQRLLFVALVGAQRGRAGVQGAQGPDPRDIEYGLLATARAMQEAERAAIAVCSM